MVDSREKYLGRCVNTFLFFVGLSFGLSICLVVFYSSFFDIVCFPFVCFLFFFSCFFIVFFISGRRKDVGIWDRSADKQGR